MKVYQGALHQTVYENEGRFYPFMRKDNQEQIVRTAQEIVSGVPYLYAESLEEDMEDVDTKVLTLHCYI